VLAELIAVGIEIAYIKGNTEKSKPYLATKPNHEQSWDGKPRLRAETNRDTRECLTAEMPLSCL